MRNLLKTVLVVVLITSCHQEEVVKKEELVVSLEKAPQNLVIGVSNLATVLSSTRRKMSNSKFDLSNYPSDNLQALQMTDGVKMETSDTYGVLSTKNPEMVLMVDFDSVGSVVGAGFGETVKLDDESIEIKMYDLLGNLEVHFTVSNYEVVYHEVANLSSSRVKQEPPMRFVDRWGDCISRVSQPYRHGLYDLAFGIAATIATGGWYPYVLAGACALSTFGTYGEHSGSRPE